MCNVCCGEFQGWCKSFTRTERLLTVLEGILLIVLIGFLTFLILHLIVCSKDEPPLNIVHVTSESPGYTGSGMTNSLTQSVASNVKCTWKPSMQTEAGTRYYEFGQPPIPTTQITFSRVTPKGSKVYGPSTIAGLMLTDEYAEEMMGDEESDGEEAGEALERAVAALVKPRPMTFGCILTLVSEEWALTAASCIEAIEEVESLDAFVVVEAFGGAGAAAGRARGVRDVRVHPRYARARRPDLAAVRAHARHARAHARPARAPALLRLPTMLDHLLLTVGERLTILGYGKFRTVDPSGADRRLRAVHVYSFPARACASEAQEAWALRHLSGGAPLSAGACAGGAACAGVLHARGLPCNYCAGTPLLARGRVLGLMADARQCGVACEPAPYVSLAAYRDWIDAVLADQIP